MKSYESGKAGPYRFLIQDFCPGETLDDYIGEHSRLEEEHAVQLWWGLVEAVDYLHGHNIVLKSLRPQKVLISPDQSCLRILDWFSWKLRAMLRGGGAKDVGYGSPHLMAPPEVLAGSDIGKHSDVFILGNMLYFLLRGIVLYAGAGQSLECVSNKSLRYLIEEATSPAERRPQSVCALKGLLVFPLPPRPPST